MIETNDFNLEREAESPGFKVRLCHLPAVWLWQGVSALIVSWPHLLISKSGQMRELWRWFKELIDQCLPHWNWSINVSLCPLLRIVCNVVGHTAKICWMSEWIMYHQHLVHFLRFLFELLVEVRHSESVFELVTFRSIPCWTNQLDNTLNFYLQ